MKIMTGFNHTLAGTAIAMAVKEPLLIAPLALLSHFVMDSLPHFGRHPKVTPYNNGFKIYLMVEAVLCVAALVFAISLEPQSWFILGLGAAFATLPDFSWPFQSRAPAWTKPFYDFHTNIQWGERPYGWIFELIGTILLVWTLVSLA